MLSTMVLSRGASVALAAAKPTGDCGPSARRLRSLRLLSPTHFSHRRSGLLPRRQTPPPVAATSSLDVQEEVAAPEDSPTAPRVQVERAQGFNARQLFAGVEIDAPPEIVWDALTDYARLQDFIPGLKENRIVEELPDGALLEQVGEEDLALGVKFTATVLLRIQEHRRGVPADRLTDTGELGGGKLPQPRCPWGKVESANYSDISFELEDGDFSVFNGIWRIQPGAAGLHSCRLSYSVIVKPKPWLPVRLVEPRVKGEIATNLMAVREFSEARAV